MLVLKCLYYLNLILFQYHYDCKNTIFFQIHKKIYKKDHLCDIRNTRE